MPIAIKLSDLLIEDAKPYAQAMHRSVPKQIEYWARLGKVAEENPDLPINMLQDLRRIVRRLVERFYVA